LLRACALLSLLPFTEFAAAKQAIKAQAVEAELPDVIVGAGERSEAISYQAIIKGLEAFAGHGHLAPRATPKFILQPQQLESNLNGLTLVLATANRDIEIAIDKYGVFIGPRIDARESLDARILLNRPDGAFALKPFVRTPGLPPNTRRLGDLRAICEMRWAIEQDDGSIPLPTRLLAAGMGTPCRSWLVKVIFGSRVRSPKSGLFPARGGRLWHRSASDKTAPAFHRRSTMTPGRTIR
jgi:hypothetical protein